MSQNIERVMERGEKLDDLVDKTGALEQNAVRFRQTSKKVREITSSGFFCGSQFGPTLIIFFLPAGSKKDVVEEYQNDSDPCRCSGSNHSDHHIQVHLDVDC